MTLGSRAQAQVDVDSTVAVSVGWEGDLLVLGQETW